MLKTKGLTPASLQIWPLHGRCVGGVPTLSTLILTFTLNAWCIMPTHADTVYRCGEAYSTSSQCANATATEVKPSTVLHTTGQTNNATSDLRDAQALEKQRLHAERQAVQTAPVRISTPHTPPPIVTSNEPLAPNGKRQGKHARKPNSPYFTAVDPNAAPKKKSTAKAVPAASSP
jgi:hypothetical protein